MTHEMHLLEGSSSRATLDPLAQTLTFEHFGSVATDEQKTLSPVIVPLGAIASVECRPGRSTNWFWVVLRDGKPWKGGVWCDPHGVVCGVDPTDFADRVRFAVGSAAPVDFQSPAAEPSRRGWRAKLAKGAGRAIVDGLFNTR